MSEKKRFAVETISTFAEVHLVYAENEEEAKKIAANADYNTSKWLGQQVIKYRDWETDRKSTRLNSSHSAKSRMPASA